MARRIANVARRQGGHVTVTQLHELGLSRLAIQRRRESGYLSAVHHGVYAVGRLPTTPLDKAHGALLAAGPRAALAGATALAFWYNERTWPEPLELISATDRRPKGLTVHHSRTLLHRDIRQVQNGLRVTSPARTALDMAPRVTETRLTRIVNELRLENRLTVEQLRDVVARNPRHPGAARIKDLIGDSQPEPTRSQLEDAFKRLITRHKLQMPQINVRVAGYRVDAYFPDHQLIVELDGKGTHRDDWKPAFEQDRASVVEIMARTGIPTIRFTWDQITRRHHETAARLGAILEARRTGARCA